MKHFYITTAIDYANGDPHIGHAYEKVLTDTIARHRRMRGDAVYFLTGLDEHGQKVQQTARKGGRQPQEMVDGIAEKFEAMCARLNISNDDFIRTTQARHKKVVGEFLQRLYDAGEIYLGEYSGYYSPRQEQFLQIKDQNPDGSWPEIFGEVEEVAEPAYFFKLPKYQDWLVEFLNDNPEWVFPTFRLKQVLEFLKEPLNDLCISRPIERLEWGIPLPFDENYVTYVWFDALTNYISAIRYGEEGWENYWPADAHVIGKDILVPPHAVYWPIMLKAAGIPLPKQLLVHGWWNIRGEKMSKTLGNIVDPFQLAKQVGADPLRYFFMREMNVGQDSDFTPEQLLARYNVLANDLGNNLNRLLNMGGRYGEGKIPAQDLVEEPEERLRQLWAETVALVLENYDAYQFHRGLERIEAFSAGVSRYLDQREPWKKAKDPSPEAQAIVQSTLGHLAEALRLAGLLLRPVMPEIATKLFARIGYDAQPTYDDLDWKSGLTGNALGEKIILFPRIEAAK